MAHCAFNHSLRRRPAVLFQQRPFDRAAVYAYSDRHAVSLCTFAKLLYVGIVAYVSGVKAYFVYAAFYGGYGEPVIEMNIGHERYARTLFYT